MTEILRNISKIQEGPKTSSEISHVPVTKSKVDTLLSDGAGAVGLFAAFGVGYLVARLQKKFSKEEEIKKILLHNVLHEKNPVVIYKGNKPFFWNPMMEQITGYSFSEIQEMSKQGIDIMELLYGWSEEELTRVKSSLNTAHKKKEGYEEFVCTLRSRSGELVTIAWHTEFYGDISVRKGSIETAHKKEVIATAGNTLRDLARRSMEAKDAYTSGHIGRVTDLSVEIADAYGYNTHRIDELKVMAMFHDLGKEQVDEYVLQKPGALTKEQRIHMDSHAGKGVIYGVKNGYGANIRGMPHHSDFFSNKGDPTLTFDGLVEKIDGGEEVDPLEFNHLMGENIPEEARIISIADVIDAIVSRRVYSKFLGTNIDEIIAYLEKELLDSTGLISLDGKIMLDKTKWERAIGKDKLHSCCIEWEDTLYIPTQFPSTKIQFDPRVVVTLYENGSLKEKIKEFLRKKDNSLVSEKIIEVELYISEFETRLEKEDLTEDEYKNYLRLKEAVEKLRNMSQKKD